MLINFEFAFGYRDHLGSHIKSNSHLDFKHEFAFCSILELICEVFSYPWFAYLEVVHSHLVHLVNWVEHAKNGTYKEWNMRRN